MGRCRCCTGARSEIVDRQLQQHRRPDAREGAPSRAGKDNADAQVEMTLTSRTTAETRGTIKTLS